MSSRVWLSDSQYYPQSIHLNLKKNRLARTTKCFCYHVSCKRLRRWRTSNTDLLRTQLTFDKCCATVFGNAARSLSFHVSDGTGCEAVAGGQNAHDRSGSSPAQLISLCNETASVEGVDIILKLRNPVCMPTSLQTSDGMVCGGWGGAVGSKQLLVEKKVMIKTLMCIKYQK